MTTFPLLKALPSDKATRLLDGLPKDTYQDGETIFDIGDDTQSVYFIMAGTTKSMIYGDDGKLAFFRERHTGDCFGYYAALTGGLRTARMVAHGETQLARMDADAFIHLVTHNPELSADMLALMARLLREETARISGMVTLPANKHIEQILRLMARADGDNNLVVRVSSREELASFTGVTRETLSRVLNGLVKDGVITLEKDKITLCGDACTD